MLVRYGALDYQDIGPMSVWGNQVVPPAGFRLFQGWSHVHGGIPNEGRVSGDVLTSQTKDRSTVDIGLHYVVTDGNGTPLHVNTNGVPDYLE